MMTADPSKQYAEVQNRVAMSGKNKKAGNPPFRDFDV